MGWFSLFICLNLVASAWMAQVSQWQFNPNQRPQKHQLNFKNQGFGHPGRPNFEQPSFVHPGLGKHHSFFSQNFFEGNQGTFDRFPNERDKSGRRTATEAEENPEEDPEDNLDEDLDGDPDDNPVDDSSDNTNEDPDSSESASESSESSEVDAQKRDPNNNFDAELTVFDEDLGTKVFSESEDLWDYSSSEYVIVLIPGYVDSNPEVQKKYTKLFCDTLMESFLKVRKYTIICYDWKPLESAEKQTVDLALVKGFSLASYLQQRFSDSARIHLVADNVGCIIAQIAGLSSFKPYNFIFGLDQRIINHTNSSQLYLSKDAANMVQLIYYDYTPIYEVQRNFYLIPSDDAPRNTVVYQAFAKAIAQNGTTYGGISCQSYYDFKQGHCKKHKKNVMWADQFVTNPLLKLPEGRFFVPL